MTPTCAQSPSVAALLSVIRAIPVSPDTFDKYIAGYHMGLIVGWSDETANLIAGSGDEHTAREDRKSVV